MRAVTLLLYSALAVKGLAQGHTVSRLDSIWRTLDMSQLVVTATRTPKTLKDVPVQTRVITAEDIRRTDATNIQDLLQAELPGVEFSYAMNQQVNMNLAGFAGQSVLILVDGERLAGETMDNVDFSRLTMAGVKRIEIIRGAASALYGSNAAGGVINIITKEAASKWSANVGTRYGSHDEWRADGSIGMKIKRVANTFDASFNRIGTYDVCHDASDDCDFRHVYGFTTYNLADRLVYRPSAKLKLTARAGYYFKERLYNPDMPDRYRDFTGGLRGEWDVSAHDHVELGYAYDQYDKSDYNKASGLDIRDYRNVQHSLRGLYSHTMRDCDVLTVGADAMRDYLASYQFAEGGAHRQYTADAFAQYDWNVTKRLELVGAVRWDYFSDGGKHRITSKFNVRYRLGRITLRAGYAQGFRAPTLKEKYMDFDMASIFNIHGNPALKAENSHNLNASAEYAHGGYSLIVGGNYNFIDNRITTSGIRYAVATSDGSGAASRQPYIDYINISNMRVYGLDATARARWGCGLGASLAYNFTHEETRGGSATQYCPARPHALNVRLAWTKHWNAKRRFWDNDTDISFTTRYLSAVSYKSMYMYEPFAPRTIHNPAYVLCKLQLSQRVLGGVQFTAAIDNIFNYRPVIYSFNSPVTTGTTFQVGVNIDIDKLL